jgi:hypothetical protein
VNIKFTLWGGVNIKFTLRGGVRAKRLRIPALDVVRLKHVGRPNLKTEAAKNLVQDYFQLN